MTPREKFKLSQRIRMKSMSVFVAFVFFSLVGIQAQQGMIYPVLIENSMEVNSSVEEAWAVLSDFGGTGSFHILYDETTLLHGKTDRAELGSERESLMPDGMFNVILKERVVNVVDGSQLTFKIYDSEKSSLESMLVTYGVVMDKHGKVYIYNRVGFNETSGVWKKFAKRKHDRDSKLSLMSYKHHIETGESEKDLKRLKDWIEYQKDNRSDGDVVATTDLKLN